MAVKELKTRLKLKYDLKTNWDTVEKTFFPLQGEVCIVKVSDNEFLMKVGDGKRNFESLPYTQAIASDVYAWAKKTGIEVTEGTDTVGGSAVTSVTWDSTTNKLVVKKGTISTANDNQTITGNGVAFDKNAAVNIVGDGGTTVTGNASGNKIVISSPTALKSPNAFVISGKQGATEAFNTSYDGSLASTVTITAQKPTLAFGGTAKLLTIGNGDANVDVEVTMPTVTKETVGLGNVQNKALDSEVSNSQNYITSGAVKSYVDSAIAGVSQFKYEVVDELPTASADTIGSIYLVKHAHSDQQDGYDEFITVQSGAAGAYTYSWEKIGNTDVDLSGYLNSVGDKETGDYIESISKTGQSITQTRKSFTSLTIAGTVYKPNDTASKTVPVSASNPTLSWGKESTIGSIGNVTFKVTLPSNPDTHYTSHLYVGATGTAQAGATGNGNTYIKLFDNTTARESYKISGSGAVTVASDASGNITINAPVVTDTNTWRGISVNGKQVLGNAITTGNLKLVNGTNISIANGTNGIVISGKSDADIKTLAEAQIKTHAGVDKTGTVTGGDGTYLTGNTTIGIVANKFCLTEDEFILDCGSSTVNVYQ